MMDIQETVEYQQRTYILSGNMHVSSCFSVCPLCKSRSFYLLEQVAIGYLDRWFRFHYLKGPGTDPNMYTLNMLSLQVVEMVFMFQFSTYNKSSL